MDACATGEFGLKLPLELRGLHAESLEQRADKTLGLTKQGEQKVLVGNLGVIAFRGQIERRIQGLLHLRGELVGTHKKILVASQRTNEAKDE